MTKLETNFSSEQQIREYLAKRYPAVANGERDKSVNVAIFWFCHDLCKTGKTEKWVLKSIINNPYVPANTTVCSKEDFDNYPIAGAYYGALIGSW